MSNTASLKLSGWAFIAGALAFVTILTGSDPIAIPGSVISSILLSVAMWRLRSAYSSAVGRLGSHFLLLGVLAPVLWFGSIVVMAGTVTAAQIGQGLWVLLFAAPAISLLGLTLFGFVALRSQPMPRLNWLPVFAGIWYPVTYALFSVYDISQKGVFPAQFLPELALIVIIQFLALCLLGSVLVIDSPKELAAAGQA